MPPTRARVACWRPAGSGNARVEFLQLDLSSLPSCHAAAAAFLARGLPLHLLVNNAGVMLAKGQTAEGFEVQFGTNHLGVCARAGCP